MPKIRAEKPAAIKGAIPHDAATWETDPFSHDHFISAPAANPTPMRAPTTVCVVDTGIPLPVATINHVAEPTSAQPIALRFKLTYASKGVLVTHQHQCSWVYARLSK